MNERDIFINTVAKRLAGCVCPQCGKPVEGGTSVNHEPGERVPGPGDWSVCAYCGALNRYAPAAERLVGLTLRPATAEDVAELERDPDMKLLINLATKAVAAYRRRLQ